MLSQFSIECQPVSFFLKPYSKIMLKFDAHTNGSRTGSGSAAICKGEVSYSTISIIFPQHMGITSPAFMLRSLLQILQ